MANGTQTLKIEERKALARALLEKHGTINNCIQLVAKVRRADSKATISTASLENLGRQLRRILCYKPGKDKTNSERSGVLTAQWKVDITSLLDEEGVSRILSNSPSPIKLAPTRLSRAPDSIVGREDELTALDSAWSGVSKKNIVILAGWGGMGKTSLAASWAVDSIGKRRANGLQRYFDWPFTSHWSSSDGTAPTESFFEAALRFFGSPNFADNSVDDWAKGEELAELINQHRTLLVLDGLEAIQDGETGEILNRGLCALLQGLAAKNSGLCLITLRPNLSGVALPDLAIWNTTTAPEWKLQELTPEAGAALLSRLKVVGSEGEKRALSARVKGHALTLTLLGRYLRHGHHGDIRHANEIDFREADEKEQSIHAFKMLEAYERWFATNNLHAELSILRMLGLFSMPATPDALTALYRLPALELFRDLPPAGGLQWNYAIRRLQDLGLLEMIPWDANFTSGFDETIAREVWQAQENKQPCSLGKPKRFKIPHAPIQISYALDTHPLIREFFAFRLQKSSASTWKAAHSRLFQHLKNSVPYWPGWNAPLNLIRML